MGLDLHTTNLLFWDRRTGKVCAANRFVSSRKAVKRLPIVLVWTIASFMRGVGTVSGVPWQDWPRFVAPIGCPPVSPPSHIHIPALSGSGCLLWGDISTAGVFAMPARTDSSAHSKATDTVATQASAFQLRYQSVNQSIPSIRSTSVVTSGIAEHRLMCTTENPCFHLLCLPVELLEDVILRLPAPAILRLRVVRRFLYHSDFGIYSQPSRLLGEPWNTQPH